MGSEMCIRDRTERTGERWRKMGEIWGRNGRETAVAEWRWGQLLHQPPEWGWKVSTWLAYMALLLATPRKHIWPPRSCFRLHGLASNAQRLDWLFVPRQGCCLCGRLPRRPSVATSSSRALWRSSGRACWRWRRRRWRRGCHSYPCEPQQPLCTGRCAAREFSQGACGVGVPRLAYSEVCAVGLHLSLIHI